MLLDRLAKRIWLPWLCSIAFGAIIALQPTRSIALPFLLNLALLAVMVLALLGYFRSYARFSDELTTEQRAERPRSRGGWALLSLVTCSLLMLGAVEYFDLNPDLVMPLVASVIIPSLLKSRSELDAFTASPRAAA